MNKPVNEANKEKANSNGTPSLHSKLVNSNTGTPFGKGGQGFSFLQTPNPLQSSGLGAQAPAPEPAVSQSDTDNESPSTRKLRFSPITPNTTVKKSEQQIVERFSDDLGTFTVRCSTVTPKLLNLASGIILLCWFYTYIEVLQDTLLGTRLSASTQTLDLEIFIGAALFVAIFVIHHSFKGRILHSETITFMRGVGIELAKVTVNKQTNVHFIPLTRVRDILLYEHLSPCKVTPILALLVYGEDKMLLPFSVSSALTVERTEDGRTREGLQDWPQNT